MSHPGPFNFGVLSIRIIIKGFYVMDFETENKRNLILYKAREKYIVSGVTKSITEALRLYLKTDATADEQIPLFITAPAFHKLRMALNVLRPTCSDCGSSLFLARNTIDKNGKHYPTSWICKKCGMEYFSDKTLEQWLEEIQNEIREQNIQQPDELRNGNLSALQQTTKI